MTSLSWVPDNEWGWMSPGLRSGIELPQESDMAVRVIYVASPDNDRVVH